ncbi:nitroreductase family protein [soil metagenome]
MSITSSETVRHARTAHPIVDLLDERWSPRSFDETAVVDENTLTALLEAARWAPSAANFQPRRFVVARRGTAEFDAIVAALSAGNQPWAPRASVLIVGIAVAIDPDGKPYRWAEYDLGQSLAHLTVQAHAEGLHVHQMGGFDAAALAETFDLGSTLVPVSVTAVGTVADAARLGERYESRELADRDRLPLEELVLVRA